MFSVFRRFVSSAGAGALTPLRYHAVADAVLDNLYDSIDVLSDGSNNKNAFDCDYSDGVLTFSTASMTFVLNKQPSLLQIWLSSPISGPWRFNFINEDWVSKRNNTELHSLISKEVSGILKKEIKLIK